MHKTTKKIFTLSTCENILVYFYTGLPLPEVGKGGGKISRGEFKTINRNKGVGGLTRKGKETKLQSDSERDEGEESWMEVREGRKRCKTS